MRTDTRFHRWSHPKRLMYPHEVVPHVEQVDRVDMVLKALAECIRQASESAHRHAHGEVLALNARRADESRIGIADDLNALRALTLRRAVAFLRFGIATVNLHQLRVVNVTTKGTGNSFQIHLVPVGSQLHTIGKSRFNVPKEIRRKPGVPCSCKPANRQLRIRIQSDKRSDIASVPAVRQVVLPNVLLPRSDETPNLIDLNPLRVHVADNAVLVFGARIANARQQAKDSAFRHARHSGRGANGTTLDERGDNRDPLRHADEVCNDLSIRQRFRIHKLKCAECPFFRGSWLFPTAP